jgi:hypothetical protein
MIGTRWKPGGIGCFIQAEIGWGFIIAEDTHQDRFPDSSIQRTKSPRGFALALSFGIEGVRPPANDE